MVRRQNAQLQFFASVTIAIHPQMAKLIAIIKYDDNTSAQVSVGYHGMTFDNLKEFTKEVERCSKYLSADYIGIYFPDKTEIVKDESRNQNTH